jgi:uncharacterized damage-inducible protein DinB
MTLDSLLKDYARFNFLANTALVDWLKNKPSGLMGQEIASSCPSIKLTLLHIWDVETGWLEDLHGITPALSPEKSFSGSIEEVFSGLLEKSEEFSHYVNALSPEEFLEICSCPKQDGSLEERHRFEIVQHCMNHSTYHRGQVVTIARILGLNDPPQTDFIKSSIFKY